MILTQKAISIAPFSSSRAYFLIFGIMSLSNKTKWYKKYSKLIASFLTLPFDKYAISSVVKHLSYVKFVPVLLKTSIMIFLKGFNQQIIDIKYCIGVRFTTKDLMSKICKQLSRKK